ncbi:MAG: cyclic nucleotide-binding domain-containing protein [Nitrospinaceae bacterium]|nr:cyclic nucleotide-binding domain-containing protein [Nitrospinaceae bacterium]
MLVYLPDLSPNDNATQSDLKFYQDRIRSKDLKDTMLVKVLKASNEKHSAMFPVAVSVLREVPFFTEVFSQDNEVLKRIAMLAGSDNKAYIRYRNYKPGEVIVQQGDIENTVYWLLNGAARIRSGNRTLTHIKPITCFGELTVLDSQERTATVEAYEASDAEVLEIDWSITKQGHELEDRFLELLLKSTTDKMKNNYIVSNKMWKGARDLYASCKNRVQELEAENEELKLMNIKLKKQLGL